MKPPLPFFLSSEHTMLLPIRCYTCGKVLGNLTDPWERYYKEEPTNWLPFFQRYNIQRYCCKRVLMSQVPDPNQDKHYVLPPSIALSHDKASNMFIAR